MFESFIKHMFPAKVSDSAVRLSPTFYLGAITGALLLMLFMSGALLLFYYTPEPAQAFSSVLFIEEKVFAGRLIRSFHRFCSHALIVAASLHLLRIILSGAYKLRTYSYRLGLFIFALIVFEAYAGYLLPMDQLSFWAAKTGLELVRILPFGDFISSILAPGGAGSRLTLTRYFALHSVLIPFTLMIITSIHMFAIRREGLSSAGDKISQAALFSKLKILLPSLVIIILITSYITGAPLSEPADPSNPPNPVKSAWFLLFIQEIVSWRAWLFNIVAAIYVALFFLPELSRRKSGFAYFAHDDKPVWVIFIVAVLTVIALTIIATYFRGANWSFGLYL